MLVLVIVIVIVIVLVLVLVLVIVLVLEVYQLFTTTGLMRKAEILLGGGVSELAKPQRQNPPTWKPPAK